MTLAYAVEEGWTEGDAAAQNGMLVTVFQYTALGVGGLLSGALVNSYGIPTTVEVLACVIVGFIAFAIMFLKTCDACAGSKSAIPLQ